MDQNFLQDLGIAREIFGGLISSLPNILKAKKKPIEQMSASDLGVDMSSFQQSKVVGYELPAAKPPGKLFKDESMDEMVSKVVQLLRDEAKVI